MLEESLTMEMPTLDNISSCCGLVYMTRSWKKSVLSSYKKLCSPYQAAFLKDAVYDEIWMLNSFFGLEKPTSIPPNIKLVGSMALSQDQKLAKLKEDEPQLFKWLQDAIQKKEDVVFVSLTHMTYW